MRLLPFIRHSGMLLVRVRKLDKTWTKTQEGMWRGFSAMPYPSACHSCIVFNEPMLGHCFRHTPVLDVATELASVRIVFQSRGSAAATLATADAGPWGQSP